MRLNLVVVSKGAPRVETQVAHVRYKSDKVVMAEVDLRTKWCQVTGIGPDNEVHLEVTDRSTNFRKNADLDVPTVIKITGLEEHALWAVEVQRYILKLVYYKERL